VSGECFVHVTGAVAYWKRLMARQVPGVESGSSRTMASSLVQDPDGNRVRFSSPR